MEILTSSLLLFVDVTRLRGCIASPVQVSAAHMFSQKVEDDSGCELTYGAPRYVRDRAEKVHGKNYAR